MPHVSTPADSAQLERSLGTLDAAAIVISNVIGVGIFTVPGIVAQMVRQPLALLGVWLAGGVLAFAGANAYAELAARHPRAGGEYVYLREGFGPLAAFLTGWTSFVAGFSGAIAAGAVGFAAYLGRYFPAAADARPWCTLPPATAGRLPFLHLEISPRAIVALALIFGISAVHIRGLGPGKVLQNSLAGLKVVALVVLIGLGFAFGAGSMQHLRGSAAAVRPASWLLALVPVMFTYSGWNAAAYVAEEVREPSRRVPRALALGTGIVVVLYLLLNVLYLYALPAERMAGVIETGDVAAEALFGPRGASAAGGLTALILLALAGGISAMVLAGPRVYFAMARDGLFLPAAARIHARYHTPAIAILAQAIWSALLVLSGTFEQLLTYTGFAVVLFSGLAVLALFLLRLPQAPSRGRRASPDQVAATSPAPYRAWGYPVAPSLFVLASFAMVVNAIQENPGPSLAGVAVIAAGIPLYFWFRHHGTTDEHL
jgi:APA family basic amino acid/polyamine antiporter